MNDSPDRVVLTEEQAIKRFANESWVQAGNNKYVTAASFTDYAINQYLDPLSEQLKQTLGIETKPNTMASQSGTSHLVVSVEGMKQVCDELGIQARILQPPQEITAG